MKVKCTKCRMEVYKLLRKVKPGESITSATFKGINRFSHPRPGDVLRCPNCLSEIGLSEGIQNALKEIMYGDSPRNNTGGMV